MRKLVYPVVVVVLAVLLAGCAFSDPRIAGTPPTPTTDPAFAAQTTAAADEVKTAWQAVLAAAGADANSGKWADMTRTLGAWWQVLTGPDPVNRLANAVTADPGALPTTPPDPVRAADDSLATLRDDALVNANAATGRTAAWWAALAACAEQIRAGLAGHYGAPTAMNPAVTLTTTDEKTAIAGVQEQLDQAVFALKAALGFLEPGGADAQTFSTILAGLTTDQAGLAALAGTPPSPSGSQGIYELPPGRDRAAALALLTDAQRGLVQATAIWVASTTSPTQAIGYYMKAAALGQAYGLGTAAWPGWPD